MRALRVAAAEFSRGEEERKQVNCTPVALTFFLEGFLDAFELPWSNTAADNFFADWCRAGQGSGGQYLWSRCVKRSRQGCRTGTIRNICVVIVHVAAQLCQGVHVDCQEVSRQVFGINSLWTVKVTEL